ncbi:MAG: stage II sporulation protein M [Hydrogenoanaerobacterium sp.]
MTTMRTAIASQAMYGHFKRRLYAYRRLLFYVVVFLVGVFAGALFLRGTSQETLSNLSLLIKKFTSIRHEQATVSTFIVSFTSTATMLCIIMVCGFCAIAQPVIVLLPFFRGLGFGYEAGCIYAQSGFNGMGYVALLLLPNMLISTLLIAYGCSEAFSMSSVYYRAVSRGEGGGLITPRGYLARFFVLFVLAAFASALDSAFTGFFSHLFVL